MMMLTMIALAAWGAMGHRLVVQIAWDQLTPRARSAAIALLDRESPMDAAVWADQVRMERRETAPLHYVNIPLGAPGYDPARDCPKDRCLITAIESYRAVLADTAAPGAARAEALRFLIHFVGDLHQPLHVSNRDDRGGNQLGVTWRGKETNLHALWDTDLPVSWAVDEGGYLKRLRNAARRMSAQQRAEASAGSVTAWAVEGNALAAEVAYQAHAGESLGPDYLRAAGPVMDLEITRAGLRLARLLNEALDPPAAR